MARFERRPTLNTVIGNVNRRVDDLLDSTRVGATRRWAVDTTAVTTAAVTVATDQFTCPANSVLEVYAHGRGTTNGANKYVQLSVYLDGAAIRGTTIIKWGGSTAGVTNEPRQSCPGVSQSIGVISPAGGFLVATPDPPTLLSSDLHTLEFKLEPVGTSVSASVSYLSIAYRIT